MANTKNDVVDWLQSADYTYLSVRALLNVGHPLLWLDAAYLLHQAIEKYLKALLILNKTEKRVHNLDELTAKVAELYPDLDITEKISNLNKFSSFRYPDMPMEVDAFGENEFKLGDNIVKLIRQRIPDDYKVRGISQVYALRSGNLHEKIENILLENNAESSYWSKELQS